jgi:microcompartment protein CcmL/EutN
MLIKVILKLNKDNTFNIKETLDKTADVYLPIPAEKSGSGKIQISVKGSVHEIDAITAGEKISVGSKVKVLEIIDNQTVLITKI